MNRIDKTEKFPLVVLDTNVLVSGLCRYENSPSYRILKGVQEGKIPIALSQKLFLEYESVLKRNNILSLIGANKKEISVILASLIAIARESEPYYLWRPNLKDESDNFVLEMAISTSAILITKNLKDFKSGELRFPHLIVMSPRKYCQNYLEE